MHISTERIFADHHQFYLFDTDYDHYADDRLAWREENRREHGYLATEHAVYISTVAGLNDHRVRIYSSERDETKEYERIFSSILSCPSGGLVIAAPGYFDEDKTTIELEPAHYLVSICGSSIGKDQFSFDVDSPEMEDEEYFSHDEFEHYDIYLHKTEQIAGVELEKLAGARFPAPQR